MRLVCPRCGAQYEIDAEAIPARGRDVECSACEHVWRAYPAGFDPAARPALSRPLDESVIEILRGEAAEARGESADDTDLVLAPEHAATEHAEDAGAAEHPDQQEDDLAAEHVAEQSQTQ